MYNLQLSDDAIADYENAIVWYENRRFAFVKKFPYIVYFLLDEVNLQIIVFAILHEKRDQQVWKKRSKDI